MELVLHFAINLTVTITCGLTNEGRGLLYIDNIRNSPLFFSLTEQLQELSIVKEFASIVYSHK